MKRRNIKSGAERFFALILFGVLGLCIMTVLYMGAGAYKRLTHRGEEAYTKRTVPSYIATKVRKADTNGGVSVGEREGTEVLELWETIGEECFVTLIYSYNGYVRELYIREGIDPELSAGESIAEAKELRFQRKDNCLEVTIKQKDDTVTRQNLTLRSAGRDSLNEK